MSGIGLALALALTPAPVASDSGPDYTTTGNGLLASCTKQNGEFAYAICVGYIMGATSEAELLEALAAERVKSPKLICRPTNTSRGQVVDVVVKYLNDHPATRSDPAQGLIYLALIDAWPCAKPPNV